MKNKRLEFTFMMSIVVGVTIGMFVRLIHFIFMMVFFSGTAMAQNDGDWEYFAGGYLTATSIDANTTSFTPMGDQVINIDASFSDLLDNLDYGISGLFIARKGLLSINVDLVFIGLNIDQPPAVIDVDLREHELFIGYEAFEQYSDLEIITGLRYIDQDIKVTTPGPQLTIGDSWVDPFIGLRYLGPINNKWNWLLRGDVGGFGMGSDLAWRIDAGTTYRFGKQWEAAIWYKILNLDYETGTSGTPSIYKWDGTESGITFGVGYYF